MASRNSKREEVASSVSPRPQKYSTSVSYPSPPSSPLQTQPRISQLSRVIGEKPRSAKTSSAAPISPPATPPRSSSVSPVAYTQPPASKLDVSTLRIRLGLVGGKCGGRTKAGHPCRCASPVENRARVASQLESMTSLTQSSAELAAALDKLAMLVHCKWHDNGLAKEARIEAWTAAFPVGEAAATTTADPAAAVEKRIRKVLNLESTLCIGIAASTDERCQRGIGGQNVQNCLATIDDIVKPEIYLDDAFLDGLLKVLETNMYCHLHVNRRPLKMVRLWKASIVEIRKGLPVKSVASSPTARVGSSFRGSESPSTKTSMAAPVSQSARLPTPPNFDQDLTTYWPKAYDTSPFNIISRNATDGLADSQSSRAKVKSEIMRELNPRDPTSGHVYVYEVDGNPGFVKIGYTGRLVEDRHQEWSFDCNRDPRVLYPLPSAAVAAVKNPHRVEELCHAELDHRRIRIYCKACLKQHLEWFEVPAAEAIAVIQRWSRWMATDPYQRIDLRSGPKWTIREEERRRTRDMDRFMQEISPVRRPNAVLEIVPHDRLNIAKAQVFVESSSGK